MSITAFVFGVSAKSKTDTALAAMGDGAHLDNVVAETVAHLTISMLLNGFACMCVCMSNFEGCSHPERHKWVHYVTSSTAFCVMRIVAFSTFLVQLIFSSAMLVGAVLVGFLAYVCHFGSTTQFHVQEVIWEIGNFTATGVDPFDPYKTGNATQARSHDTAFISSASIMQHLDLAEFCPLAKDLGGQLMVFWMSAVLSLVSQALMAVALNGEKERVSVHEQHESAADFSGRSLQEGAGLLSSAASAGSAYSRDALGGFNSAYKNFQSGHPGH
eukprot:TRINITY_DN1240_c5_g1_i1.p1 TRINITY_DN1240_c5_g1~~TRINITY_DN1240_c5_g1_i1.p1  ORF type:complete len:312 (+),score=47.48 TRINITY_DN1240_c5_g1_i1:122-937(+)